MKNHFPNILKILNQLFVVAKPSGWMGKQLKSLSSSMLVALIVSKTMFKFTMKSNASLCMVPPFDINPLTKMWYLSCNNILDIHL